MTDSPRVTVDAGLDRSLVWTGGDSVRYLVVRLEAGRLPGDRPDFERRSHNLGFVIDRSESMKGPALDAARRIAGLVAGRLDERDLVSIVAFDRAPQVLIAGAPAGRGGQERIAGALAALGTGAGSDLYAGWAEGAEQVAGLMTAPDRQLSRLFLISDGRSPRAMAMIGDLRRHARALAERDLPTTGLAIGADAGTAPLVALDDREGDWLVAAADPDALARLAVAEYLEVDPVVARDVGISVRAPLPALDPIGRLSAPGRARPARGGSSAEDDLGRLREGSRKISVFRMTCPRGTAGESIRIKADVTWSDPLTGTPAAPQRSTASLTFAHSRDNTPQPRDRSATQIVASAWKDAILRDVLRLNTKGAHDEADRLIAHQLHHIGRYCKGVARDEFRQLQEGLGAVHGPWSRDRDREHAIARLLNRPSG